MLLVMCVDQTTGQAPQLSVPTSGREEKGSRWPSQRAVCTAKSP